CARYGNYGAYW
nr:immunoglobulin heavy chain junction region [Mus musculus]MBK4197301.1 immunoglobulin heavy chain junction region [Mus musculus]MBK4197302.1 immunoglobulin heavy chain junction region [Mus musculus]MBK4197303.1 immunoglobulin heavy chain junction region [Mus musculus]MBK4197304.1 immunoglobulin heavy chain junction region [Mus musculus]